MNNGRDIEWEDYLTQEKLMFRLEEAALEIDILRLQNKALERQIILWKEMYHDKEEKMLGVAV